MGDSLILLVAIMSALTGMIWLALGMDVHWRDVHGPAQRSTAKVLALRSLGGLAIFASLLLCLLVDHPSMAVLVWVMALTGSALAAAFLMAWRPSVLRFFFPR